MAAAKEAGAPKDALDAMGREIAAIKAEAVNSWSLGARLNTAEAKLATAESKVQTAELQLAKAIQGLEEARAQRKAALNALAEVKAELPTKRTGVPLELMRRTKALLERLETGSFAISADVPEGCSRQWQQCTKL